jgi:hypothetical protein
MAKEMDAETFMAEVLQGAKSMVERQDPTIFTDAAPGEAECFEAGALAGMRHTLFLLGIEDATDLSDVLHRRSRIGG